MHWMHSIRTRLVAVVLGASLLVGLTIFLLTPRMVQHELLEAEAEQRAALVMQAYRSLAGQQRDIEHESLAQAVRDYFADASANTANLPLDFTLLSSSGELVIQAQQQPTGLLAELLGSGVSEDIFVDGALIGHLSLQQSIQLTERELVFMHALDETLLSALMFALALLLPLAYFVSTGLSRSLRSLTEAVNKMAAGELSQQVRVSGRDESAVLAHSFNKMNSQLVRAYQDLAESKALVEQQADQLRELSVRDELTGLYNRRHFNQQANQEVASALRYEKPLVFALGDVDHFKSINDNFSHAVGDQVLAVLAKLLNQQVRETDLLARYGGEELAFALPNTATPQAMQQVERIRQSIEQYNWREIHSELKVTMSFGVAELGQEQDFQTCLDLADARLYRAKSQGRNQVCGA